MIAFATLIVLIISASKK
ncbi:MAG: hypothetical protein ACI4NX_06925 [Megasphaera elsdenii]